jgi:ELWxxDGT repeat protein
MYFEYGGQGELWQSGGADETTAMVPLPERLIRFVSDGDVLWVFAGSSTSQGLYRIDTPGAAPRLVARVAGVSAAGATERPVARQGRLFLSAFTPETGLEPWTSDGTAAGTLPLRDIAPGTGSSSPAAFTPVDGGVCFTAQAPGRGQLWFSDGTPPGTRPVLDVASNASGSTLGNLTGAANLCFAAHTLVSQSLWELWVSDGTPAGTHVVSPTTWTSLSPGVGVADLGPARMYFVGNDGVHGKQLWVTDGSAAGTRMLTDAGTARHTVSAQLRRVNSRLFFTLDDGFHGNELWVLDLCPADFNNDGATGVQDVLDYLGAWLGGETRADVDAAPGLTIQDVLAFIAAYFAGCN